MTYTYDIANRLETAKADDTSVVWYYVYDHNGNRLQQIPGGLTPTENAVQYSYDQNNRLTQVETHDGNSFQLQAEMVYNGRGHRLQAIAYAEGRVFTATYAVDPRSGLPLLVDNGLETTLILYGQVAIGEYAPQTAEWTYYLGDNQLSVRQLVDAADTVTKVQTYGPYGVLLHQAGDGSGLFGYKGGQSAANGLWYFGGGYFDPATGQFLSANGNPWLPLAATAMAHPGGFLFGPILFVSWRRRKGKKRIHPATFLFFGILLAASLSACDEGNAPIEITVSPPPEGAGAEDPTPTGTPTLLPPPAISVDGVPTITPTPTFTCTPSPTPCSGAVFLQGVPLYSQMETQPNPDTACGPTALAMALNFSGVMATPADVINFAIENNYYLPWQLPFTAPVDLVNIASHYATPTSGNVTDATEAQKLLRDYLCQNIPIIIDVTVNMEQDAGDAAHFVVVVGIDENNNVTVHDPYSKRAGASEREVDWSDLWWSWQSNSDKDQFNGAGFWMVVDS